MNDRPALFGDLLPSDLTPEELDALAQIEISFQEEILKAEQEHQAKKADIHASTEAKRWDALRKIRRSRAGKTTIRFDNDVISDSVTSKKS